MRRLLFFCLFLTTWLTASEQHAITFFQESKDHRLLCREAEFSYRVISQKNAELIRIEDDAFFHLKKEDIYLTATGCMPLTGKKEAIVF